MGRQDAGYFTKLPDTEKRSQMTRKLFKVFSLSKSTTGTADEQTQAVWQVANIVAEVAELRECGVEIMEDDTPEIKTKNGVADMGAELHAWFIDPSRNSLSLS